MIKCFIPLAHVSSYLALSSLTLSTDLVYSCLFFCTSSLIYKNNIRLLIQGSRSLDFGAQIRPHSQCQKVCCFFPNSIQKILNLTKMENQKKKIFFFFFFWGGFSILISYNTNTEHIVTYLQFHRIMENIHTCFLLSLFS